MSEKPVFSLVLYHRGSVCSCRQTFCCWTSRLCCRWCIYVELRTLPPHRLWW